MQGLNRGDGTLPIVARLLAVESASPDFIGVNDGGCHTCYHRNPDGPEAAELITTCDEAAEVALVALTDPVIGTHNHDDPDWYRKVDEAVAALKAAKIKARSESGQ